MKTKLIAVLSKARWSKVFYVCLLSLPVIIYLFKFSILYHGGIFHGEDWDYFAQNYEAARLSILHYHQFPWWNPWMNGGQPLFANPQFGLFSLQMPLVLLFGTISGLHLSILVYFLLGFWGMYLLIQRLGSKKRLMTALLSYIWLFSGFSSWHLAGGHFTFAIYLLSPWAFLTTINIYNRRGWLWFALVASLMINSAAHYLTFEVLIACIVVALVLIIHRLKQVKKLNREAVSEALSPFIKASIAIMLLSGLKLIYTLQFTKQYPRLLPLDPPESWKLFIASIAFRHPVDPAMLTPLGVTHYGWIEYANYFGLITLALFCYLLIRKFEKIKTITPQEWLILIATGLSGLIMFGGFSSLSPFAILHKLPVFNQMRVPSRFICWFVFGIILFMARLPRKPIVYLLLAMSAIDVFLAGYPTINYSQVRYEQKQTTTSEFRQYEFYKTNPELGVTEIINIQDLRLLRATQQNIGEVYGYEPILDVAEYYFLPGTKRCGINKGCEFVITKNARVIKWSPNEIKLRRTGAGSIELNMNPGKVWRVNGQHTFSSQRILEMQKRFIIADKSQDITVTFDPVL